MRAWDEATQKWELDRWLSVNLEDLYFFEEDWRRSSNLTIRADPAWYDAREHTGPYGNGPDHGLRVMGGSRVAEGARRNDEIWRGHDFILRLGTRDGLVFPCELDAWLMPEADYYRTEPQPATEAERFAEGPPTLRVIEPAVFSNGGVAMLRVQGDPIAHARQRLREAVGFEQMHHPRVEWAIRKPLRSDTFVRIEGGRSTVYFSTRP